MKNGDKLTEGTISPKKLLDVADVTAVENYILKEVQKVYRSQGISISDKHIEVIVRQMLRKWWLLKVATPQCSQELVLTL